MPLSPSPQQFITVTLWKATKKALPATKISPAVVSTTKFKSSGRSDGGFIHPDSPAYYFDVEPGDILVFAPQIWHQTEIVGDGESLALTFYGSLDRLWRGEPDQNREFYVDLWQDSNCAYGTPIESYQSCLGQWLSPPTYRTAITSWIQLRFPILKFAFEKVLKVLTVTYCEDDPAIMKGFEKAMGMT